MNHYCFITILCLKKRKFSFEGEVRCVYRNYAKEFNNYYNKIMKPILSYLYLSFIYFFVNYMQQFLEILICIWQSTLKIVRICVRYVTQNSTAT